MNWLTGFPRGWSAFLHEQSTAKRNNTAPDRTFRICVFYPLPLGEGGATGHKPIQILRPSPYPLPEVEGRSPTAAPGLPIVLIGQRTAVFRKRLDPGRH